MLIYGIGKLRGSSKINQDKSSDFHTIIPCTKPPTHRHTCTRSDKQTLQGRPYTGSSKHISRSLPHSGAQVNIPLCTRTRGNAHRILKGTQPARGVQISSYLGPEAQTSDCSAPLMGGHGTDRICHPVHCLSYHS